MSTHHGNGGNGPPDGDRDHPTDPELPELPPEWGRLEVPDDPSALAAEAEQVREELAQKRRAGRAAGGKRRRSRDAPSSTGTPLLIIFLAVVVTLVSLAAVTWSGSGTPDGGGDGSGPEADDRMTLPPLELTDPGRRRVALVTQVPMVLLLVEECRCPGLLAEAVAVVPDRIAVVAVGHTPPTPPEGAATDPNLLRLADPDGSVRAALQLSSPPPHAATLVLVDAAGRVTEVAHATTTVTPYQREINQL